MDLNPPLDGLALTRRLRVDVHLRPGETCTLADDVRDGLSRPRKQLHPKHLYDDLGSVLFDRICDTPEYYQTRTELALLRRIAHVLVERPGPTDVVELGSGAARKTRALLDAVAASGQTTRYVPMDVSESMLEGSARKLLAHYPWLRVHGVVGDYERHLHLIPPGKRHLIVFLGSTIGNFPEPEGVRFLQAVAGTMGPGDRLLLGTDLVKDPKVLHAAYNDAEGVTAAFNKNVLTILNRELQADFDLEAFEHVAFFNEERSQIEMHLRSRRSQRVTIPALELQVDFADGETIHTEISRKFTEASAARMLRGAGLEPMAWYTPDNDYFALSLSRRAP